MNSVFAPFANNSCTFSGLSDIAASRFSTTIKKPLKITYLINLPFISGVIPSLSLALTLAPRSNKSFTNCVSLEAAQNY